MKSWDYFLDKINYIMKTFVPWKRYQEEDINLSGYPGKYFSLSE